VEAGLVVLTEDQAPFRSLRIIVGQPEANAIFAGWHGNVPGRPSTWDLFVSSIALLGGRIDRVVITAVHEERHYFAQIEIEHDGERRILACRPSDGIALAVRAYNVDLMAEPSVLDAAGVLADGSKPAPAEPEPEAPTEPEPEAAAGVGSEASAEAGTQAAADPALAEREAALAAREAEVSARERALREREGGEGAGAPPG
jgi:hypothetical protein